MSVTDISTSPAQAQSLADLAWQQRTVLPNRPFGDMALALSGGGFRASAFCLGCMAYLNRAWLDNPADTLLTHVTFSTSTSGGSLTNAAYSAGIYKPGFSFDGFYTDSKQFMEGERLINCVSGILTDSRKWQEAVSHTVNGTPQKIHKSRNLINAFAKAYDEMLFKNVATGQSDTLDIYFNHTANPHLKTVCFNATEFNNGIAFRFQTNGFDKSIFTVGNYYLHFNNAAVARQLKISDITATSSCFPAGFEPMVYPDDYVHPGLTNIDDMLSAIDYKNNDPLKLNEVIKQPFCMMDGGIVDNQGLQSIMGEDNYRARTKGKNRFDLMMVCDAGSYFADRLAPDKVKKSFFLQHFTINKLTALFALSVLCCAASIALIKWGCGYWHTVGWMFIVPTFLLAITYLCCRQFVISQKNKLKKTHFGRTLVRYLAYFAGLKLGILNQMLMARLKSVGQMATSIFLAQERRQSYNAFYTTPAYKNRALSCFIYEFASQHDDVRKSNLEMKDHAWWPQVSGWLTPTAQMQDVATKATAMATTLWFDDGPQTMRDNIIACGQFTMCYSLLKHIYRLEVINPTWQTDTTLQALKQRLIKDWMLFKADPLMMV